MCGIAGILSARSPLPPARLAASLRAQEHRGPDGSGIWERDGSDAPYVQLGHRRLAIIDLSDSAAQPMTLDGGQLVLTFNGEIYNYREIRAELQEAGCSFRSSSDTEVLLLAYRQWGEACVDRLNGMFAFAIWDEGRKHLFAARDRFGEKPFHFHWDPQRQLFAFASEIKGLIAAGFANGELNDQALASYVEEKFLAHRDQTLYQGVRRLLPARAMRVDFSKSNPVLSQWTYWKIDPSRRLRIDEVEAANRFRELFDDSIRLRLRSDVRVGTSLSGGIDSSAVVCTIHALGIASGQKTFTARMEDPALDEGEHVDRVLNHTGIEGHSVVPTAEELCGVFSRHCYHMEEPFPATSMFAQYLIMRLARQHDVTVLLDGQGADEMLAGYQHYFRFHWGDLVRRGRWLGLSRELQAYSNLRSGQRTLSASGLAAELLTSRTKRTLSRPENSFREWWSQDWVRDSSPALSYGADGPYFNRLPAQLLRDSFQGPLQELLRYGDRNSMAWSRELRQPFLDHRLAEFIFSLGPESKIARGITKAVLRRSMRGRVPDRILDRHDKVGYQAPQAAWLRGELREWTEAKLEQARQVLQGRLDNRAIERFRDLPDRISESRESRDIFMLITLGETLTQLHPRSFRDLAT